MGEPLLFPAREPYRRDAQASVACALLRARRARQVMKHAVLRRASRRWRLAVPGAALAVLALSLTGLAVPAAAATGHATSSASTALSPRFNRPGNILIADQFNNRVIEVD